MQTAESMNRTLINSLCKEHDDLPGSGQKQTIVFSPGRINLIGEHLDYNDGPVTPGAIDKGLYFVGSLRNDQLIYLYSSSFRELLVVDMSKPIKQSEFRWANYLLGVISQFQNMGKQVPGFNLVFGGDLPIGSGLSSSAALECGIAVLLNNWTNSNFSKIALAQIAQRAEHDFSGVYCGIMDQFACMFGEEGHLIYLNSNSLNYNMMKLELTDHCLVLINSLVKHDLATSHYNERRAEARRFLQFTQAYFGKNYAFGRISDQMIDDLRGMLPSNLFDRGEYVIEEIRRVELAKLAIENNDLDKLGKLMTETHWGLSEKYQVSCEELDFLVLRAQEINGVLGARMMGGGFGGCTLNLMKKSTMADSTDSLVKSYENCFGYKPEVIPVNISSGASIFMQETP